MKSVLLRISVFFICGSFFILSGCMDDEEPYNPYKQLDADIKTIDTHLANLGLTAEKDLAGIRMVVQEMGNGLPANANSTVKVAYTGRVLNATTPFDAGVATGLLRGFISGWQYALTTLPVGSKATIYIPSPLGYANEEKPKIPKNSILVFDIDFEEITRTAVEKDRFTKDTTAINTFVTENNIENVIKDPTGIRYVITNEGSGVTPAIYDKIKTKVVYKLLAKDAPAVLTVEREPKADVSSRVVDNLGGVIAALKNMKEGATATVYIPSILAFGTDVYRNQNNEVVVPANSNLIVEVSLIDIVF